MADNIVKTTDHLNRQFVERTDTVNTIRMDSVKIKTLPDTVKVTSDNPSNMLIVSHSTYGEVGVYPIYFPLILGHLQYGILGIGYLSSSSAYSEEVSRVINRSNTFTERFVHTDFVDTTNTTATVVAGTGVSFTAGEVYQSKTFAKNNTSYTSISYSIEGTNTDYLTTSTINSSTDGLVVKFTSSSTCNVTKFTAVYG